MVSITRMYPLPWSSHPLFTIRIHHEYDYRVSLTSSLSWSLSLSQSTTLFFSCLCLLSRSFSHHFAVQKKSFRHVQLTLATPCMSPQVGINHKNISLSHIHTHTHTHLHTHMHTHAHTHTHTHTHL